MLNEILHRLTNKSSDDLVPGFPVESKFVPSEADSYETDLRNTMLVNAHPFYLRSYLQLIHSFPDVLSALGQRDSTYNAGDPLYVHADVVGGSLVEDSAGNQPKLYRAVSEWPVRFSITYSYFDADYLQTNFRGAKVPYTINGSGHIEPEWPVWSGVVGAVVHDENPAGIAPGELFVISQSPAEFPSTALASKLVLSKGLIPVLRKTGLLNHYHWAETNDERVAVTAAALCLYNRIEYKRVT